MSTRAGESAGGGWFSAVISALVTFALIAAAGLAVALVVVPRVLGGMSLTVLTGSMEPGIFPGDIVVTRGIDEQSARDLAIGDVITFLPYPDDPTLVTHRIMAKTVGAKETSFITQGDHNRTVDPWGPVHDYQVRGQVAYVVPKLGWVREWVGRDIGWIIPIVGVVMIVTGLVRVITSGRGRDDADDPDDQSPESTDNSQRPRRARTGVY